MLSPLRVEYVPVFRIDGNTSEVTHLRNGFASGLSLRKITLYRSDSLMMVVDCLRPKESVRGVWHTSSSSKRVALAHTLR